MGCCRCCETIGACCNAGVCSETTCADCEDAGGLYQGVGTECVGDDDDECPCDPPADPGLCQKCVDGTPTVYCPESKPYCCDGVCQEESCGCSGECEGDEDCDEGCVCVDGDCVEAGFCCFKNPQGSHNFTFLGYADSLSFGAWSGPGTEYLTIFCTSSVVVCGVEIGDGLRFEFFDGTDAWEAVEVGNAFTYPCESSQSLVGTYTLTNCNTNATATLTIT